jgi:hypothetical protein
MTYYRVSKNSNKGVICGTGTELQKKTNKQTNKQTNKKQKKPALFCTIMGVYRHDRIIHVLTISTCVICGTGTAYPSGAPEFSPDLYFVSFGHCVVCSSSTIIL